MNFSLIFQYKIQSYYLEDNNPRAFLKILIFMGILLYIYFEAFRDQKTFCKISQLGYESSNVVPIALRDTTAVNTYIIDSEIILIISLRLVKNLLAAI